MIADRPKYAAEHTNENGVALVITLTLVLVLSLLLAGILFVTQGQVLTSYSYRLSTQSRDVAEAGVQNTINWLLYNYTPPTPAQVTSSYNVNKNPVLSPQSNGDPAVLSAMSGVSSNYPDSTQQTNFNAALNNASVTGLGVQARYSVYAKLLRMKSFTQAFSTTPGLLQTWEITSQGTLSTLPVAQSQVVATFERMAKPIFTYAAFATANTCSSLNFDSGGSTDSYDSTQGTYPAGQQNTGGNLGTNGNLLNQSTLTIGGNLSTPYGNTQGGCPGSAASGNPISPTGGLQTLTPPTYATPPIPSTPNNNFTMPSTISPGTYGNAVGCSGTYTFQGPGTFNFNSIDCSSGATFNIGGSGPVIINIGGVGSSGYALNFQSGLSINAGGKPSDFQIVYGGTAGINMQSGASPLDAVIYAPNSDINFQSSGDFFGAMIGKTVLFQSNGALHYDRSLANDLMVQGSYYPVSFSWSKF